MIMMRLNNIAAHGYASYFRHFSNFDDRENPLYSLHAIAALYQQLTQIIAHCSMLFFIRTRRRKQAGYSKRKTAQPDI